MTRWDAHLAEEQLVRLALTVGDHDQQEETALAHVSSCDDCSARLAAVTATLAGLRDAARDEADAHVDAEHLERQRRRVLARIAHLGEPARVLHFPGSAERTAGPGRARRRWVSVAAAAGLIIGLLAGQGLHLLPARSAWQAAAARRATLDATPQQARFRPAAAVSVSDDELLGSVESALQLRRGPELQALDSLTPAVFEGR
jgi:hypothetical protein